MPSKPIQVLVVDDHAIIRKGVRALIDEIEGIEIIGEARDGVEAITQENALQPDVILMDLVMPNLGCISVEQFLFGSARRHALARLN